MTLCLMEELVVFTHHLSPPHSHHTRHFQHWPSSNSALFFPSFFKNTVEESSAQSTLSFNNLAISEWTSLTRPLPPSTSPPTQRGQTIVASLLFEWIHQGARSFSTSTSSGGPWFSSEPAEHVRARFAHKHKKCITENRGWLHGFSRQKGTEVEPQWAVKEE